MAPTVRYHPQASLEIAPIYSMPDVSLCAGPESEVRTGLPAGGNRIRTIGPAEKEPPRQDLVAAISAETSASPRAGVWSICYLRVGNRSVYRASRQPRQPDFGRRSADAGDRPGLAAVDSDLTGRELRRLRVGCQQFRKARGSAARHAAFSGYAVDPDMAQGGGEASSVAGHVVAVNETEIELGFR